MTREESRGAEVQSQAREQAYRAWKLPPASRAERDPLEFLIGVMTSEIAATAGQVKAAIAAAPYIHQNHGNSGKKDAHASSAKKAASGKFSPAAPPANVLYASSSSESVPASLVR